MGKHLPTALRLLMGFVFTAAALAGLMGKVPPPKPDAAQAFMGVLASSGLIYMVKITELVCGLALLAGRFVPLALVVLAPIIANIAFFKLALDPAGAGLALVLIVLWLGNAFFNREVLVPLLRAK